jgi:hypothetical protein
MLSAGHGAIAAPSQSTAGVGLLTRIAKVAPYIVHSDKLLGAFLELEAMLRR